MERIFLLVLFRNGRLVVWKSLRNGLARVLPRTLWKLRSPISFSGQSSMIVPTMHKQEPSTLGSIADKCTTSDYGFRSLQLVDFPQETSFSLRICDMRIRPCITKYMPIDVSVNG